MLDRVVLTVKEVLLALEGDKLPFCEEYLHILTVAFRADSSGEDVNQSPIKHEELTSPHAHSRRLKVDLPMISIKFFTGITIRLLPLRWPEDSCLS